MLEGIRNPQSTHRRLLAEVVNPSLSVFDDSATQERRSVLAGRIGEYVIVTAVIFVICGIQVGQAYFKAPPNPLIFIVAAIVVGIYAAVRIAMIWPQMKTLQREDEARAGLKAAIHQICRHGYLLFDGVKDRRGFLMGSVLVGPSGVYSLVPRFIPRGSDLSERVEFLDSGMLAVGSHPVLANPLGQARHAADSLTALLAEDGLPEIKVVPMVVIPGWKIGSSPSVPDAVSVVNEVLLPGAIEERPTILDAKALIAVSMVMDRLKTRS
jgi:hypothetical protein